MKKTVKILDILLAFVSTLISFFRSTHQNADRP